MFLFINTTSEAKIEVALLNADGHQTVSSVSEIDQSGSEHLLDTVDQLMQKAGWNWEQAGQNISDIIVRQNPTSRFSVTRSAVVTANFLGLGWNVAVRKIQQESELEAVVAELAKQTGFQEQIKPVYDKEPIQ